GHRHDRACGIVVPPGVRGLPAQERGIHLRCGAGAVAVRARVRVTVPGAVAVTIAGAVPVPEPAPVLTAHTPPGSDPEMARDELQVPVGDVGEEIRLLALLGSQRGDGALHLRPERSDPVLVDDETEARPHLVAAVPVLRKDLQDALDGRQELLDRHELRERLRYEGRGPEPAADHDLEAVAGRSPAVLDPSDEPDVMDRRRGAVLGARGEGDLEL